MNSIYVFVLPDSPELKETLQVIAAQMRKRKREQEDEVTGNPKKSTCNALQKTRACKKL